MCLALVMVVAGVSMLANGLPAPRRRPRRQPVAAAVDRRRLRAHPRRAAAPGRRARRPLRPSPRAAHRPRRVRRRVGARGRRPDRRRQLIALPGADGHRRRADHARHAVDDHERLPARGAGQGGRHLGRLRRRRRHARHRSRRARCSRQFYWGSIFLVDRRRSPRSLLVAVVARRARRPSRREHVGLDPVGAVLSALGIGAPGARHHRRSRARLDRPAHARRRWSAASCSSPRSCSCELRSEAPLLDPRLFRHRGFATGSASLFLQFFAMFGFFFVSLQFLQLVLGYSTLTAAVALLPMARGHAAALGGRRARCRSATATSSSAAPGSPSPPSASACSPRSAPTAATCRSSSPRS